MKYADAGGMGIAYDDEGARADDAVVFLPGWRNSGRNFFALLAERLAARHRVIRLTGADTGTPAVRARTSAMTNWPATRWRSSRQPASAQ